MYAIEKTVTTGNGFKERLHVKSFKDSDKMYGFLNKGDNSLFWKESEKGLKKGIYAFAGGQWHNIKSLDMSVLAHI